MPDPRAVANVTLAIVCISGPLFFLTSVALAAMYLSQRRKFRSDVQRIAALEDTTFQLKRNARLVLRDEWFRNIRRLKFHNEVDVEVKFVYPLLQFLGYASNDCQLRVPVTIQVGRQINQGEADWVVWRNTQGQRFAMIVVEAKAPGIRLDTTVQRQAQSYAFALNAPIYVLTNGSEIQIFRRGVQGDTCIVACSANNLFDSWAEIEQAIGAGRQ